MTQVLCASDPLDGSKVHCASMDQSDCSITIIRLYIDDAESHVGDAIAEEPNVAHCTSARRKIDAIIIDQIRL
jgi:hypothetical protein